MSSISTAILVAVNREGDIVANFVAYDMYGGYDWLADVDANKLPLNSFPSILNYLQHHSYSNLEIKYLGEDIISAEIISMQRDGGYKEPLKKIVQYGHKGYGCLNDLASELSIQLQSENQKKDVFEKRLLLEKSY